MEATVVRGSRNRAGGGPALTDYGLASRRQAVWWGDPRSSSSSPLSLLLLHYLHLHHLLLLRRPFSFPRPPALPCWPHSRSLDLSFPLSIALVLSLLRGRDRVRGARSANDERRPAVSRQGRWEKDAGRKGSTEGHPPKRSIRSE